MMFVTSQRRRQRSLINVAISGTSVLTGTLLYLPREAPLARSIGNYSVPYYGYMPPGVLAVCTFTLCLHGRIDSDTEVKCKGDQCEFDLEGHVEVFQEEWDKLLKRDSYDKRCLQSIKTQIRSCISATEFSLQRGYLANIHSNAQLAVLSELKQPPSEQDEWEAPPSAFDSAEAMLSGRRRIINLLCKVTTTINGIVTSSLPVPSRYVRSLTTREGQRPIREAKVNNIYQLFVGNPDVTPLQMQMVCLNHALIPSEAYDQYLQVTQNMPPPNEHVEPLYGVSGGNHYYTAVRKAAALPALRRHPKVVYHNSEMYALGWLRKLDEHYEKAAAEDKAHTDIGSDGFPNRRFENFDQAETERQAILPAALWDSMTPAERCVIPSVRDAIAILVREHNDVSNLHEESTFEQKLVWLRDRCEELKLPPEAARLNCKGVPDKEVQNMMYNVKAKKPKDLVPILRVALAPEKSYGMVLTILGMFKNYALKGQQKPKPSKSKNPVKSQPKQKNFYDRKITPLFEDGVPEEGRVQILQKLIDGQIELKDVGDLKQDLVAKTRLIATMLTLLSWDFQNNALANSYPKTFEECLQTIPHAVSDARMEVLVRGCEAQKVVCWLFFFGFAVNVSACTPIFIMHAFHCYFVYMFGAHVKIHIQLLALVFWRARRFLISVASIASFCCAPACVRRARQIVLHAYMLIRRFRFCVLEYLFGVHVKIHI